LLKYSCTSFHSSFGMLIFSWLIFLHLCFY
jgi:hypothetical protein